MIIKAEQKFLRQTPTRLRIVARAVKHLLPAEALDQLKFMNKSAAREIHLVLKQALANATNNLGLSRDALTIKDILIGEGPRYKRFIAASRGQAHAILKRTAHVRILLESKEEHAAAKPKKVQAVTKKGAEVVPTASTQQSVKPMSLPKQMKAQTHTTVKPVMVRKTGER